MKRIAVLSWSESNMADYDWSWGVYLTERKHGTFSVSASQTVQEPPRHTVRGSYGLRTGKGVRDAIERICEKVSHELDAKTWLTICDRIATLNEPLATQVRQDLRDEEGEEE